MASPTHRATSTLAASTSTSAAPGKPTGTVDNDGMLAAMYIETTENPVTGMTPPSGWSQVQDNYNSTSGQEHHVIIWKKLASSEGASWTWNWTNSHYREMTVVSYSGVLTSEIEDTSGKGTNSGGSTNINCGNISPASANTKIIAAYADFNGSSGFTPPSGFTERDDHSTNHGGALSVSDKDQAAAGATGSVDATSSISGATTGVLFAMASEAAAAAGQPTSKRSGGVPFMGAHGSGFPSVRRWIKRDSGLSVPTWRLPNGIN